MIDFGKHSSNRGRISISQVLKVYLQKVGYSVTQCFNGGQALVMFRETQPDLVLLDIMLPEKMVGPF